MSFTPLTRPLVSFTVYARWTFFSDRGKPEVLYQANPTLKNPKAIVPLVLAAADRSSAGGSLRQYLRPADVASEDDRAGVTPPTNPIARRLWDAWAELYTEEQAAALPKTARAGSWCGYNWGVWDGYPVEGSFQMLDYDKSVVGLYDLARRPFTELADALGVGDALAAILKEVS